jgi:hypothetical protein
MSRPHPLALPELHRHLRLSPTDDAKRPTDTARRAWAKRIARRREAASIILRSTSGKCSLTSSLVEAQHINAALCRELGTFCIMCGLFRTKVNATIDFNGGQLMLDAKQVENELPVGMLSPKLEARQLPITSC